jgi:hypothetical protein
MKPKTLLLNLIISLNFSAQAAFLPVCDRTPAVKDALEKLVLKPCANIEALDLAKINRVAVNNRNIAAFKSDDFTGLTGLEILNIRSNPYTELPEGLLNDLVNLKTLVIIGTSLRHYPDDFLSHNPNIENIHVFRNPVRTISESYFSTLQKAKNLKILDVDSTLQKPELDRLNKMFPAGGPVDLILN